MSTIYFGCVHICKIKQIDLAVPHCSWQLILERGLGPVRGKWIKGDFCFIYMGAGGKRKKPQIMAFPHIWWASPTPGLLGHYLQRLESVYLHFTESNSLLSSTVATCGYEHLKCGQSQSQQVVSLKIQGLNPGLLHCRQILYYLSHQGSQKYTPGFKDLVQKKK